MFARKRAWRAAGLRPPRFLFIDGLVETRLTAEQVRQRLRCICVGSRCRLGPARIWGHPLKKQGFPFVLVYCNVPMALAYYGTILDHGSRRLVVLAYAQPAGLVYSFGFLLTLLIFMKLGPFGLLTMVPITLGFHVFRRISYPRCIDELLRD